MTRRSFSRPPPDLTRDAYDLAQAEAAAEAAEQAANPQEARAAWARACRFRPQDWNLAFRHAAACLAAGDAADAARLFAAIAAAHPGREVLQGLAAASLALGDLPATTAALSKALQFYSADAGLRALARVIGEAAGMAWCGLSLDGVLHLSAGQAWRVTLDGQALDVPAGATAVALPPGWEGARALVAQSAAGEALGSTLAPKTLFRVQGIAAWDGPEHVSGWAWLPQAPEAAPVLLLRADDGPALAVTPNDLSIQAPGEAPLVRARGFRMAVAAGTRRVTLVGPDGVALTGTPLWAPCAPPRLPAAPARPGTAVVVPVYRGREDTLACIAAVRATLGPEDRLIVVNDASPEPALVAALAAAARGGGFLLIDANPADPACNLGFPAAANAGLRAAAGQDVVLLNSDTLVFPGWLATLRRAAHAAPDTGTVTPLSNDATIFSYPSPERPAAMPEPAAGAALAALAASVHGAATVEVPTGHGFCLYLRHDCLAQTGLLREDVFAQGYGEENDFCERARALGWRHQAAPGVYVAHRGGGSFGAAKAQLLRRNAALLDALHPEYHRRIAAFIAADPLGPARRALDAARLRQSLAGRRTRLIVTHGGIGGTQRVTAEREAAARQDGAAPLLLTGDAGIAVLQAGDTPNLRFALPEETGALIDLLRAAAPEAIELHHLLGHAADIVAVLEALAAPLTAWVHDWGWICPRLSFITPEGYFCGEAPPRECDSCTARGERPVLDTPAAALRARSGRLLAAAEFVHVSSADGARRMRRHFGALRLREAPLEPAPPAPAKHAARAAAGNVVVAIAGAIGIEKGYAVLLACCQDAAARGLALRFALTGYTIDDPPLLATGMISITGPFAAGEAAGLIRSSGAALGFLPSIWPETWCFALSDLWGAGLDVAVFDIGAPAERVQAARRGLVLPLGLPASRVNDVLLAAFG